MNERGCMKKCRRFFQYFITNAKYSNSILGDLSHALAEGCERVLLGAPFLCAFTAPRITC